MYDQMKIEEELYQLRPMNCPYNILVYKRKLHSYRDFPIRVAELGTVYRYELSGTLHGLFRVRGFTQDDAHIFCLEDQIKDEIRGVLDLTEEILLQFGFSKYEVNLSTRPDNALDKAKQESRSKDEALRKLEENYQNLECKSKNKDHFSRNQQEKVTEIEVELESRTEFCKQFEKQLMQQSDQLKEKEEICMTLQHKVNELENKLKEHELVQSKILQHKVMNLESELKERSQAFELHSATFQEKDGIPGELQMMSLINHTNLLRVHWCSG